MIPAGSAISIGATCGGYAAFVAAKAKCSRYSSEDGIRGRGAIHTDRRQIVGVEIAN